MYKLNTMLEFTLPLDYSAKRKIKTNRDKIIIFRANDNCLLFGIRNRALISINIT